MKLACIIHGSFRRHFSEIQMVRELFIRAGIEVLAPTAGVVRSTSNGFALLDTDESRDPRLTELLYLHHLKRLGKNGFSYFVNPEGYIGKSTSYELGVAQLTNVRCFFMEPLVDHPAYIHRNAIWKPDPLAEYVMSHRRLPEPQVAANEAVIHNLWEGLMVPGSVVAVGGIIEYDGTDAGREKEVLLVKTHKWGGRYSIVGGKVRRHERLTEALQREIREETGLASVVGEHLCTFDELDDSGYYRTGVQHIFVDNVVRVESRMVHLNEEAEEYVWAPARIALRELSIEPNARLTLERYVRARVSL